MIGLAVRGDRNRAVDHLPDADFVQHRDALRRFLGERREAIEIRRQQLGPEVARDAVGAPGARVRLPAADGERAGLRLHVEVGVGIAQRGQAGRNAVGLLGDEILMLDGARGNARADHRGDLAAPHAGGVDHAFGFDVAGVGDDGRHAPPAALHARHAHALHQRHAARPRAGRIGVGEARRIDVAVALDPGGAFHPFGVEQRERGRGPACAETSST